MYNYPDEGLYFAIALYVSFHFLFQTNIVSNQERLEYYQGCDEHYGYIPFFYDQFPTSDGSRVGWRKLFSEYNMLAYYMDDGLDEYFKFRDYFLFGFGKHYRTTFTVGVLASKEDKMLEWVVEDEWFEECEDSQEWLWSITYKTFFRKSETSNFAVALFVYGFLGFLKIDYHLGIMYTLLINLCGVFGAYMFYQRCGWELDWRSRSIYTEEPGWEDVYKFDETYSLWFKLYEGDIDEVRFVDPGVYDWHSGTPHNDYIALAFVGIPYVVTISVHHYPIGLPVFIEYLLLLTFGALLVVRAHHEDGFDYKHSCYFASFVFGFSNIEYVKFEPYYKVTEYKLGNFDGPIEIEEIYEEAYRTSWEAQEYK